MNIRNNLTLVNYAYSAGAGAADITPPAGSGITLQIQSITATASAAGASIQIDTGDLIPVAATGVPRTVNPNGGLQSDDVQTHTIHFVGTDTYFVDWFHS